MTEKACPKTLGVEVLDDGIVLAYGAPCMQDRCMAWDEDKRNCRLFCGEL